MADKPADKPGKKPFVSHADRPEVRLRSDTPIGDLTVRDLATILGQVGGTGKDFWDGKDWIKDDFDGTIKWRDAKDNKDNKDNKEVKDSKESKEAKDSHKEKREIKEIKAEKLELDGVFDPHSQQPDPRIEQVIRALSGMSAKVDQLADQIEALKKGKG
ncbi:MAG: hypothetical protein QOD09_726 [Bradyrhizobium sp.]|jgi:hypothetical protein|nr:hypothetical protein [Bradyrhizobium sp.]